MIGLCLSRVSKQNLNTWPRKVLIIGLSTQVSIQRTEDGVQSCTNSSDSIKEAFQGIVQVSNYPSSACTPTSSLWGGLPETLRKGIDEHGPQSEHASKDVGTSVKSDPQRVVQMKQRILQNLSHVNQKIDRRGSDCKFPYPPDAGKPSSVSPWPLPKPGQSSEDKSIMAEESAAPSVQDIRPVPPSSVMNMNGSVKDHAYIGSAGYESRVHSQRRSSHRFPSPKRDADNGTRAPTAPHLGSTQRQWILKLRELNSACSSVTN
mmetsp:Transcript_3033/g.5820  ORF Transcript_3033/g.5820 Transcript_3033/m.5820 type:complete len:262 (+) Transcript_3033:1397-2182(+)